MTTYTKIWLIALTAILAGCLSLASNGIHMTTTGRFIPVVLSMALSWSAYRQRQKFSNSLGRIVAESVHGISLFAAISMAGALASYALAAKSHGWMDAPVVAFDRRLGFDWLALYQLYMSYPLVTVVGRVAYSTIAFTPLLLIGALSIYRRSDLLARFLTTFALSLALTIAIFAFFPMQSAYSYLLHGNAPYLPITRDLHVQIIEGLRSGTITSLDFMSLCGLITFPSFHTTAAVLFAWTAWPIPVYRKPMLVLNAAMIAATPIEGTHYIADLIGGGVVAILSIGLCQMPLLRRARQPARRHPSPVTWAA